jgi:hypothetical protein
MAHRRDNFLILTVFKINFKINPWKTLFAPGDPLAAPDAVAGQTSFATPHAAARQGCHAG